MTEAQNRQLVLKQRPETYVDANTFALESNAIPDLGENQVRIQVTTLEIMPTYRIWIAGDSYLPAVPIGDTMRASGIGRVLESSSADFAKGDLVTGLLGAQEVTTADAGSIRKLPELPDPEVYLHVLGINGLTAYFGLKECGKPKSGETLVVSTAAGSVGSIVIQLGKIFGMRTVGITGSAEKVKYVTGELGADVCIDYKATENLQEALARACPDGIDVYFDNVGGNQLDACLALMNKYGRIIGCGAIDNYNGKPTPITNYMNIIGRSLDYHGFIVSNYVEQWGEGIKELGEWMQAGQIKYRHQIMYGLENFGDAMNVLFNSGNLGKLLLRLKTGEKQRQLILKKRPGENIEDDNLAVEEAYIPELGANQVRVQVTTLEVNPTQKGWMTRDSYMPAVPIGDVMRAGGIGIVQESTSPDFAAGDLVSGMIGAQEIATVDASVVHKLPVCPDNEVYLNVLGINGFTAYFGMMDIGKPKEGETLVVSTAAGSVGSIVVCLGKIMGMKVVGITGSEEKVEYVTGELGADACINYKTTEDLQETLGKLCPDGIDVYFDNVGGNQLDACLALMNKYGRIVACGSISGYGGKPVPVSNYTNVILKSLDYQGFIVLNYRPRFPEAIGKMSEWLQAGKIKYRHHLFHGLENYTAALKALFSGDNIGKILVRLVEKPSS